MYRIYSVLSWIAKKHAVLIHNPVKITLETVL